MNIFDGVIAASNWLALWERRQGWWYFFLLRMIMTVGGIWLIDMLFRGFAQSLQASVLLTILIFPWWLAILGQLLFMVIVFGTPWLFPYRYQPSNNHQPA